MEISEKHFCLNCIHQSNTLYLSCLKHLGSYSQSLEVRKLAQDSSNTKHTMWKKQVFSLVLMIECPYNQNTKQYNNHFVSKCRKPKTINIHSSVYPWNKMFKTNRCKMFKTNRCAVKSIIKSGLEILLANLTTSKSF